MIECAGCDSGELLVAGPVERPFVLADLTARVEAHSARCTGVGRQTPTDVPRGHPVTDSTDAGPSAALLAAEVDKAQPLTPDVAYHGERD